MDDPLVTEDARALVADLTVRRLVAFASLVGMMRTAAPLGTVVNPFTCSTAWKT